MTKQLVSNIGISVSAQRVFNCAPNVGLVVAVTHDGSHLGDGNPADVFHRQLRKPVKLSFQNCTCNST